MNRVLNLAVVAAATLIIASTKADAAVVNITEGSTSGYTMTDGNTYVVQNSVSFSNSKVGGSGMSVADNATVVLYVPAGITLTAIGAHGSGQIGGGAGILVPETAMLIITGEGTVKAMGGNAGNGGDGAVGSKGTKVVAAFFNTYWHFTGSSGLGGAGGVGGGGAGAAIGGSGGSGGYGGEAGQSVNMVKCSYYNAFCQSGNNGMPGYSGCGGIGMGVCYVLGRVNVTATAGSTGDAGSAGHYADMCDIVKQTQQGYIDQFTTCGGGGGGGGGAGCSPSKVIGGGGSSGGGGGGGGSGATLGGTSYSDYPFVNAHGGGGIGGLSRVPGETGSAKGTTKAGGIFDRGHSSYRGAEDYFGGDGGVGGAAGVEGGAGTLYVSPTATVNVEREILSATTHLSAQYLITFDANGGEVPTTNEPLIVTLGCELPSNIPMPQKSGCVFLGWAENKLGTNMWCDAKLNPYSPVYTSPSNTALYAVWELLPPSFVPGDGTIFGNSLSVSISCPAEGATIHYTTDGSEPTVDSPVYRRFRISGRTTVKAIAEEDGLLSDVVTAEYALGQCADPVISPSDGASFEWDSQVVSINWQGEDGVLRYTTDGSDPTNESPIYNGPFTINDTTIVKAKAFGDQFFDSAIVTANITRVWTSVAMPQIEAANSFTGSKTKVVISCVTDGATVRYTLDGSEPNSHSTKYTGPFYVKDSCTVKAYAAKYDYRNSTVVTHEIVKEWGIGVTMGKPDHGFTTDGTASIGWTRVVDATAPNGEAMRSGAITHSQQSILETKVMGPGTLTFSWRTSCEDSGGYYDWDHIEFAVDGTVRLRRDGISSWVEETVRINGDGEHTVTWTYKKDDVEKDGDDAAYVAGYGWVSDYTETKTTDVPIPYAWLLQNDSEIVDEFDAYEAAANATAANGHNKIWECYVTGISPTNEAAEFSAKIEMKDGAPVVTWKPDLNTNGIVRIYKVYGSETLENGGDWQYPTNSLHKFFKVTVEMP